MFACLFVSFFITFFYFPSLPFFSFLCCLLILLTKEDVGCGIVEVVKIDLSSTKEFELIRISELPNEFGLRSPPNALLPNALLPDGVL